MDKANTPSRHPRSALFTVRLWIEDLDAGTSEVRMQVRHVLSGETRYFRDWAEVVAFLLTMLQTSDIESQEKGGIPKQVNVPIQTSAI